MGAGAVEWVWRHYSGPIGAGLTVVAVLVALLAVALVVVRRHGRAVRGRVVVWAFATATAVLAIVALTLVPSKPHDPGLQLVPLRTILWNLAAVDRVVGIANLGGNLALFVPFGVCLGLVPGLRVRGAVAISVALSILVETGQYLLGARVADVDDVILNAIGGLLGALLARAAVRRWPFRRARLREPAVH